MSRFPISSASTLFIPHLAYSYYSILNLSVLYVGALGRKTEHEHEPKQQHGRRGETAIDDLQERDPTVPRAVRAAARAARVERRAANGGSLRVVLRVADADGGQGWGVDSTLHRAATLETGTIN
ncbi:hypothetical protein B0H15DRAFT_806019 [Mycena belliarum]|uniref:Uncharacterized protein n=1 Tax=Mycena belliarum TaxID=1033014 RepID=A0AAD6XMK4_9AGAR|nr:hypothetical protein B0H15DRAFT_806019 [Mycena belliae]